MSVESEAVSAPSGQRLREELGTLRVWADLLARRADELERAYAAREGLPPGVRALLPVAPADQPLPLERYPLPVLEQIMLAERAYAQALAGAEAALAAARLSAERRHRAAWHAGQS